MDNGYYCESLHFSSSSVTYSYPIVFCVPAGRNGVYGSERTGEAAFRMAL